MVRLVVPCGGGTLTITLFLVLAGLYGARCWATGYGGMRGLVLLGPLYEGVVGGGRGVCHLGTTGRVGDTYGSVVDGVSL